MTATKLQTQINYVKGPHIDAELKTDKTILGSPNKPWTSLYTQQGDCMLVKCVPEIKEYFNSGFTAIPKDAVVLTENLVLKGSTNSHALYGGEFQILKQESSGQLFVRVTRPCVLAHVKDLTSLKRAEHNGQWIPNGDYFFRGLLETDHIAKIERQVID